MPRCTSNEDRCSYEMRRGRIMSRCFQRMADGDDRCWQHERKRIQERKLNSARILAQRYKVLKGDDLEQYHHGVTELVKVCQELEPYLPEGPLLSRLHDALERLPING